MRLRTSLILLALILLSACAVKWETLSEPGFTVEMPGTPKKETQSVGSGIGSVSVYLYTVETGGEVFLIGYSDMPARAADMLTDPEELLNKTRDGELRSMNGKVSSERSLTLDGRPGKEFVGDATTPEEGTFIARIYWDKPRLYQILYVRPKGKAVSEKGEKFLSSFKLTGK